MKSISFDSEMMSQRITFCSDVLADQAYSASIGTPYIQNGGYPGVQVCTLQDPTGTSIGSKGARALAAAV